MRKKDNDAKNNESLDEVAAVEAEEGYNKPIKTDSTVRSILKQPKLGFYQKAPVIKKKRVCKSEKPAKKQKLSEIGKTATTDNLTGTVL
jgi:hypothetical protein